MDGRFPAILQEDFGVPTAVILEALDGEPQRQAIAILAWASSKADPAHVLACWSKKHRKGAHRPGQHRRACRTERPREISPRPTEDRDDRRRPTTAPRPDESGESLRGVRCEPARLDRIAERLGG